MRLSLALAVILAANAAGQTSEKTDEPFSADRPGFAASPTVLSRGWMQIEGGITFSVDADADVRMRSFTFGSPLVRIGVGRSAELRIGGDGFRFDRCDGIANRTRTAGWSDLALGAKFAVVHEGRTLPAISVLPSLSVPTGQKAFTSSTYDPTLAVAWLKTLPAGLSVGGTVAGTNISEARLHRWQDTSAISVGFPAPAGSTGFMEIYAVNSAGVSKWVSDAGITRNFGPDFQLDIEAGRQVSSGPPCWFVAAGFALRHTADFFSRRW